MMQNHFRKEEIQSTVWKGNKVFRLSFIIFLSWLSCSLEVCLDQVNGLLGFLHVLYKIYLFKKHIYYSKIHFLNDKNYVSQILEMLRWDMARRRLGTTGLATGQGRQTLLLTQC